MWHQGGMSASFSMYAKLFGIWVSPPTDGMGCEWDDPCARRSACNLDDGGIGKINDLNLCTQHAKIAIKRHGGRKVIAEDLEEMVRWERAGRAIALRAFCVGWDAAMESLESEEE